MDLFYGIKQNSSFCRKTSLQANVAFLLNLLQGTIYYKVPFECKNSFW